MSDIPSLPASLKTTAAVSADTPHGSLAGDLAAHNEGLAASATGAAQDAVVSTGLSASSDGLVGGLAATTEDATTHLDAAAGAGEASGWLDLGFEAALRELASLALHLRGMFEGALPL